MLEPSSTPTDRSTISGPGIAVRASGLVKSFGDARALDRIDVSIPAGELVGLVGANGSGKSTLLNIIFGVIQPDTGTVEVLGLDPRRSKGELRAKLGYAGQDQGLDPEITGYETLRLFHALRRLPAKGRDECLATMVERYELTAYCHRPVGTYSGGQRQRLHLALETLHGPSLLLLDEPTSSLDPGARRELWRHLDVWRGFGNTIVVASHDLPDVAMYCDRVLLLGGGRLLADGHPDELIARHAGARTVITLERPVRDETTSLRSMLESLPGSPEVTIDGATITLWRERHPQAGEPALAILAERGIPYRRFERQEPDLASVYFKLTGVPLTAVSGSSARPFPGSGRGRGAGSGQGRR